MGWLGLGVLIWGGCDGGAPIDLNRPPVVRIRDLTLSAQQPATLRPAVSDPDGDVLAFAWSFLVVPPLSGVAIDDATAPEVTFLPDKLGDYLLELAVSDAEFTASVTVLVTVLSGADRPLARAGADQIVAVGASSSLDAGASQAASGEELAYFDWRLTAAPADSTVTFRSFDPTATFVADVEGEYRIELTVHDGSRQSASDEVVLDAKPEWIEPGDVRAGQLRPEQAYVVGLAAGDCQLGVAHWSDLDTVMGGMNACEGFPLVRLDHTGAVLYLQQGILRQLVCDDCPDWTEGTKLKGDLTANDLVLDTAPCDGTTFERPTDHLPGGDGSMLLRCGDEWRVRGTGQLVPDWPLSFDGGVALLSSRSLYDIDAGVATPIEGLPSANLTLARTAPGGFHTAIYDELWFVDASTAEAIVVGSYPPVPEHESLRRHRLDGMGSLIQYSYREDLGHYQISRRRLDGVTDVRVVIDDDTWLPSPSYFCSGP
ncbi:MAG: PKD domain-containing protein [Myxococcales bacterium]|nr:PKD domain-containing protein [Myxococcales bacterium]